ncbi:Signal transduction histidine kinase [Nocardia amikacinitolerans]|uniref:histidine kinase n=1 Tax=Nocardia amikacinitolerans TaxID=756689 RepID=A0A285M0A0_9NOCA|nr:Signal transduction histidine kinase [Nocardia amikacinitolerans]SNY89817.1 Signal transduction histidine kinase [Nocardia amikacinitolerans]
MRVRSRSQTGGAARVSAAASEPAGFGRIVRPRTIRGRLARILFVSLTLVLTLLGLTLAREVQAFRRSGDTVDAVSLALVVQDLLHEAQRERGLSNGLLGGDIRLRQAVADQRGATDRALRTLDAELSGAPAGSDEISVAVGQLAGLPAVRAQVDAGRIGRAAAFQFYTDAIDALNRPRLGLDQARDAEVRHGLLALYALGEAKEQTARERGFLNGVFAADGFEPGEYVHFLDIRAAKTAGLAAFARDATAAQREQLDAVLRGADATNAAESERVAIDSSGGPLVRPVDPSMWWAQMTAVIDDQRAVQQAVGDAVRQRAAELRRTAALTLAGFLIAALLAIAVEIALVVAGVRAIVRPLAALAAEADDVAGRRLPEVIAAWHAGGDTPPERPQPVRTPAGAAVEIAAVATALDRVQATAYDLSSEQALLRRNSTESMANLARRNQNLVRRQLGLISEFEREELDPKALSNLFELDHLATRMRRNAESLLVLVGEGSPRRWAEPIALTDVIRAGLSEVDDYRRVVLRRIDEVTVAGAVVSELAHMLAELIENGLAFSPPDLEVEIHGRKLPGGYLLAVVDHGVGLPPDQLAEANARLRGDRDFMVAPTRYLGHYVVGRLAKRLGIDVELTVAPVCGIVARLLLPTELLGGQDNPSSTSAGSGGGGKAVGEPLSRVGGTAGERPSSPLAPAPHPASIEANGVGDGRSTPDSSEVNGARHGMAERSARAVGSSMAEGRPGVGTGVVRRESPSAHALSATIGPRHRAVGVSDTRLPADQGESPWFRAPSGDEQPAVQRTRNGLVKRTKRTRPAAESAAQRRSVQRPPAAPAVERSPDEVRGMLAAFRTGHQRGSDPAPRAETSRRTADPAETTAVATTILKGSP